MNQRGNSALLAVAAIHALCGTPPVLYRSSLEHEPATKSAEDLERMQRARDRQARKAGKRFEDRCETMLQKLERKEREERAQNLPVFWESRSEYDP